MPKWQSPEWLEMDSVCDCTRRYQSGERVGGVHLGIFFFFSQSFFFKKIAISTTKMAKRAKAPKTEKDQNMIGANGRKNDSNNTGKTVGWQHFLLTHFGEKKSIFGVQKIYWGFSRHSWGWEPHANNWAIAQRHILYSTWGSMAGKKPPGWLAGWGRCILINGNDQQLPHQQLRPAR